MFRDIERLRVSIMTCAEQTNRKLDNIVDAINRLTWAVKDMNNSPHTVLDVGKVSKTIVQGMEEQLKETINN